MSVYDDMAHDAGMRGDEAREAAHRLEQRHREHLEAAERDRQAEDEHSFTGAHEQPLPNASSSTGDPTMTMHRPFIGSTWTDAEGRTLTVDAVNEGNTAGREVIGTVRYPDSPIDEEYACTLPTWADIWRDRLPAANPERMQTG